MNSSTHSSMDCPYQHETPGSYHAQTSKHNGNHAACPSPSDKVEILTRTSFHCAITSSDFLHNIAQDQKRRQSANSSSIKRKNPRAMANIRRASYEDISDVISLPRYLPDHWLPWTDLFNEYLRESRRNRTTPSNGLFVGKAASRTDSLRGVQH